MARNKPEDKKEFLIAARKKIAPGISNAPVWVMQKAGKRIWNSKAKKHWRSTDLGKLFKKKQKQQKEKKKLKNRRFKLRRNKSVKARHNRPSRRKRGVL